MALPDPSILAQLEPISTLSPGRLKELANLCFIEKVSKDIDPFRMNVVKNAQAMYLLKGDLGLRFVDGAKKILRGGSEAAKHSVNAVKVKLQDTIALTEIEIVRIDLDLLDIMMTWDQLAGYEITAPSGHTKPEVKDGKQGRGTGAWMSETNIFSAGKLQNGVFSRLPPANIDEMFKRMTHVSVEAGQVIITQGAEGDYYYLIEKGTAEVTRVIDASDPPSVLAELKEGDAFGEEALVSENKRNATIIMKTDGVLLRLNKTDFIELLKAPLINQISMTEAKQYVQNGAVWLDVRFPSEFKFDHMPNALNAPLNEIRNLIRGLEKNRSYISYCQTGRRSSAAAFILAQHGLQVFVLNGGTRSQRFEELY
ncbi:MAG TPA: cyclic nucleotide-binding domain-containing protein [Methylophilaceae bacterium]|nr:cyclic nucleotide-binding domain-containing protein [Methylophilaceae bacterium]